MNDISATIPENFKQYVNQEHINAVCKDLEGTKYDIVRFYCIYKKLIVFSISWTNKPRYAGIPFFIAVDKNYETEWYQDIDAWIAFSKKADEQLKG